MPRPHLSADEQKQVQSVILVAVMEIIFFEHPTMSTAEKHATCLKIYQDLVDAMMAVLEQLNGGEVCPQISNVKTIHFRFFCVASDFFSDAQKQISKVHLLSKDLKNAGTKDGWLTGPTLWRRGNDAKREVANYSAMWNSFVTREGHFKRGDNHLSVLSNVKMAVYVSDLHRRESRIELDDNAAPEPNAPASIKMDEDAESGHGADDAAGENGAGEDAAGEDAAGENSAGEVWPGEGADEGAGEHGAEKDAAGEDEVGGIVCWRYCVLEVLCVFRKISNAYSCLDSKDVAAERDMVDGQPQAPSDQENYVHVSDSDLHNFMPTAWLAFLIWGPYAAQESWGLDPARFLVPVAPADEDDADAGQNAWRAKVTSTSMCAFVLVARTCCEFCTSLLTRTI